MVAITIDSTIPSKANYRRESALNCFRGRFPFIGPGRGLPGWLVIALGQPQGAFGVHHHRDVRSSDTPRWWKWWAAAIAGILLFAGVWAAINQLPKQVIFSPPIDSAPSPAAAQVRRALPIVEVRRALPAIEIRRALPAVPRALLVGAQQQQTDAIANRGWQSIRMPDGSVIAVRYEGELPSSAALPAHGAFIGQEYSTGNTSWIWTQPAGTNVASWVDP